MPIHFTFELSKDLVSAKTLSHKEQLHEGLTTELLRQIGHQNAIHWNSSQI